MSRLVEALERSERSQHTAGSPAAGQTALRTAGVAPPQSSAWDLDSHGPALSVDDLSEFLLVESHSDVASMLAVSALHEFFVEAHTEPPASGTTMGSSMPPGCAAGLAAGGPGDSCGGGEHAPTVPDDDRVAGGQDVDVVDVVEEPGIESEIQRAAADFQRFAEGFHAFASQCEHRGAL